MKPCKRMQPVARMAKQEVDEAAQCVADCNRVFAAMRKQLDELLAYRDDYARGMRIKGRSSVNVNQIRDYGLFLERLNSAIERQQEVLKSAEAKFAFSKQVWTEKQQHARAIDSVVDRYQQVERRQQLQREQRESDEHAQHFIRRWHR